VSRVPAAPAAPVASPGPAPVATEPAPAGEWQTYTNVEVGFSIQMPPTWSQQTLPDQNNGAVHGMAFTGPEGGVEVYWGVGFGGACPSGTEPVQLAQGELPACHTTNSDGTEVWSQIGYQVSGGNACSVRAYTSNAEPSSHDLVLQVLATLAFMPPAQPQAGAATANPASENCINVGGTPKTETRPDGGQYGVCYFGDNYVCEQWALLHGECPAGGVKVTGYSTPAARYCAITGGKYVPIGTTDTGQEAGNCTLPSGKVCDAGDYYNGACSDSSPEPGPPTAVPPIGKPNPAAQYCAQVGGTLKMEQRADVGQIGVCYFADNKQCEEWALEKGYCPVGGVKVTGYNTPAARYCAITGGKYTPTGMTPDGQEDGNCVLPNGEVCGAWQYYNGYCSATF
jgi:putative hemolysin